MDKGKENLKIQQLAKAVNERIASLQEGRLSLDELSGLVTDAREVYEQCVIIRYKAIDSFVKADLEEEETTTPEPIKFRVDKGVISQNQTSLIDAIEEIDQVDEIPVAKQNTSSETDTELVGKQVSLPVINLSGTGSEIDSSESSLPESVGEKLTKAPIDSIRAAIGLNQKFRFINELFDGDTENYSKVIDELDATGDLANAMAIYQRQHKKCNWDDEDEITQMLADLVERRHL